MRYIWGIIPGAFFISMFWFINQGGVNITLRNFGWVAFVYLCLSLIISPLVDLTGKQSLRPYRKVFGVLAFFVALVHTGIYFYYEYLYNETLFVLKHFYGLDVASGVIAIIVISLLGITSLNVLHRAMGKYWKNIHMLVFPLFCIVALHVAFASRFDAKYMIFIALVVVLRVFAFLKIQEGSKGVSTNGKYLCVPCGFIYDPVIGDPDSGIAPGTPFESIPDTWKCPVCGVTKSDFIPYTEKITSITTKKGTVVEVKFLNSTTIEYSLELKENIHVIPGQFAKILLSDKDGEFSRSYSVVKSTSNTLTFCVKIGNGRGSKILSQLTVGQELGFGGIFGNFVLQNTSNIKVFIATGTGLAPIMNMLSTCPEQIEKHLFFGLRTKQELFYEDSIKKIKNLSSSIFLSQESIEGYQTGRIDVSSFSFPKETEFYICGNPDMVHSHSEKLKNLGYTGIYSEKFN